MPAKNRRMLFSLGSIAADASSDEFDLSSATHAFLHMKRAIAATDININFHASPQPFGTAATWHQMTELRSVPYAQSTLVRSQMIVWSTGWPDILVTFMPMSLLTAFSGYAVLDTPVPQRMRITLSGSTGLEWAYIEGLRSIS